MELKYRGRLVTAEDILSIRELIAAHPRASRRRLSQKLCEVWQWKQAREKLIEAARRREIDVVLVWRWTVGAGR